MAVVSQPPRVSVIIPMFNAERYVAETIESVLCQDWDQREIIVVDDGSTDRSVPVVRRFGASVTLLEGPHLGLAQARNRGMEAARGEFLAHLDADDLLTQSSITARMRYFMAGSGIDVVTGHLRNFVSPDLGEGACKQFPIPPRPCIGHLPGASIIRAEAFQKFGPLDASFASNADLEWYVRARDLGAKIHAIDDVVALRRIHGNNMSLTQKGEFETSRLKIIRASLERRRKRAD